MSYSLIYDKQFVKVTDKLFIPMILAGDNNVYEAYRNRRCRDWSNFLYITKGNIAATLDDMLEVMSERNEEIKEHYEKQGREYDNSMFGSWSGLRINGSIATFGTYTGVAKTGCKKALTVEQLAEEGVHLNFHTYHSNNTDEALREQGLEPVRFTPKSTKELIDFIENVAPKYKGKKEGNIYANFSGMYESKPKWLRRKYFPPKPKAEKVIVNSPCGYAIKILDKDGSFYGYLHSYRGGSFRYSQFKTSGKQFLDKKKAERWAKKIDKRRIDYQFKVVLVEYGYERGFRVTQKQAENITLPEPEPEVQMTDEELIASLELKKEGEVIANFFDPDKKCKLDPLGVALHDFIKGCEVTQKYDKMQQALGIFREKYPEEYYVLLD